MPILQITPNLSGTAGVNPRWVFIESSDDYAAITAPGYLNTGKALGFPTLLPTDFIFMSYAGGIDFFGLDIAPNGIITLSSGQSFQIVLPTVAGDFVSFYTTPNYLYDNGYNPSDLTQSTVVMNDAYSNTTVSGQVPTFSDSKGSLATSPRFIPSSDIITDGRFCQALGNDTIGNVPTYGNDLGELNNSNFVFSNPSLQKVAMATTPTVATNYAIFADINGTLEGTATPPGGTYSTTSFDQKYASYSSTINQSFGPNFTTIAFNQLNSENIGMTLTDSGLQFNIGQAGTYLVMFTAKFEAIAAIEFYLTHNSVTYAQSGKDYTNNYYSIDGAISIVGIQNCAVGDTLQVLAYSPDGQSGTIFANYSIFIFQLALT